MVPFDRRLSADAFTGARTLADWKQRVRQAWPKVSLKLLSDSTRDLPRGERLRLSVAVALNGLTPAEVRVEYLARRLLPQADRTPPALSSYGLPAREGEWRTVLEAADDADQAGETVFALDAEPQECGAYGRRKTSMARVNRFHPFGVIALQRDIQGVKNRDRRRPGHLPYPCCLTRALKVEVKAG